MDVKNLRWKGNTLILFNFGVPGFADPLLKATIFTSPFYNRVLNIGKRQLSLQYQIKTLKLCPTLGDILHLLKMERWDR